MPTGAPSRLFEIKTPRAFIVLVDVDTTGDVFACLSPPRYSAILNRPTRIKFAISGLAGGRGVGLEGEIKTVSLDNDKSHDSF